MATSKTIRRYWTTACPKIRSMSQDFAEKRLALAHRIILHLLAERRD